jgi:hypothetical protein
MDYRLVQPILKCAVSTDGDARVDEACFFRSHDDHLGNPICDVMIYTPTDIGGCIFTGQSIKRVYDKDMIDPRGACEFVLVSARPTGSLFKIIWNTEQNMEPETKKEIISIE